jgi:hypothetical protein
MDTQQMMELLLDMKTSLARLEENAITSQQGILAMNEKMDANIKAMLADEEQRKAEREAWREEMRADREQWKAKMDERMTATQAKTDVKLKELTEPREEMMQSAEERHEIPREDAVVIPVRGRKRRHRGRRQAAGYLSRIPGHAASWCQNNLQTLYTGGKHVTICNK